MALKSPQTPSNTTPVELFRYESINDSPMQSWEAFGFEAITDWEAAAQDKDNLAATTPEENQPQGRDEAEKTHAEEWNRIFESGRMRGLEEGRAAEREAAASAAEASETRRIEQFARLVERFDSQRKHYFESAEAEVVQLALAVAARILRRESQMDPLLLTGAVRVALGQLSSTTQVRLCVPAADLELWTQTIAHVPNLGVTPVVVADEKMQLGECMLECELGSVDLGIASQLAEIERGFFDRTGDERAAWGAISVKEDMAE